MQAEKLVSMANQIGRFFASQPGDEAASAIAEHLRLYWDPRMRRDIIAHARAGGQGLDAPALAAVRLLDQQPL